jgi:hypothetical protein
MQRIPRFSERSLYTLSRRADLLLRRFGLNRFVRGKRVRLIRLNGQRYKRLTLPDSYVAQAVAANLDRFREHRIFPRVITVMDQELVLEFVEGTPLPEPITPPIVDQLVRFFSILYDEDRRAVKLAETAFERELRDDLDFLANVSVLSHPARADLHASVDRIAPNEVWVGYDFMDALRKNFVLTDDGRFVAIDVEDLLADQLIGGGMTKAVVRMATNQRERLLDGLAARTGLDLRPAMPFIELHFLARWTKQVFLKGSAKLISPELFDPYR